MRRAAIFIGPNACGKTTLFRTLLGLLPTLSGAVDLGNAPITTLSHAEIARRIAYVPQAHAPSFPFEALEVVLMGRTARLGVFAQPGRQDREAARAAMERLGIGNLALRDYSRLSTGHRQLVLIARAMTQDTPLIVLGEPTACLDFGNRAQVLEQIGTLARNAHSDGRGVILLTLDPDQAFALDARVLLMQDGKVRADGPAVHVLTDANLSQVYGVGIRVETTNSGRKICLPTLARQSMLKIALKP